VLLPLVLSCKEDIQPEKDLRCVYTIEQSVEFDVLDEFARRLFDKLASSKAAKAAFLLDEFARRLFDKLASSKAAKVAFLLDEFARQANSSI
jgi:hypothetical protein